MDLRLSDNERLILSNQYEILAALNPSEKDDNLRLAKQLRDGHEWLYRQSFQNLSPLFSDEETDFVHEILQLYSTLKHSYELLHDKEGIEAGRMNFPGFDGNDSREADMRRFAQALKEDGRYEFTLSASPTDLNSHSRAIPGYRRMIAAWRAVGAPSNRLTRQQMSAIIEAKYAE
ncbi:YfbU family protein [Massilia sp. P8910]|uniref:YfbU family protein n=1 Tax=Massilia antarctica TaxID=2765360 RepID=UPI001E3AF36A|nr:YfbU family protein [Massilia antarctica]MCE3606847.1 YfbU family protein [Massilia antarctica]